MPYDAVPRQAMSNEDLPRIEQVVRVESPLDLAMQFEAYWAELGLQPPRFQRPDPVLPRDRPAQREPELHHSTERFQCARLSGRIVTVEDDGGMHVPVTHMPWATNQHLILGADLRDPPQQRDKLRTRYGDVVDKRRTERFERRVDQPTRLEEHP